MRNLHRIILALFWLAPASLTSIGCSSASSDAPTDGSGTGGASGSSGASGGSATAGATGSSGKSGGSGGAGASGASGAAGSPGAGGAAGAAGNGGTAGAGGTIGASGSSGSVGASGMAGAAGSGTAGAAGSGTAGAAGSGTAGAAGTTGSAGSAGTAGSVGASGAGGAGGGGGAAGTSEMVDVTKLQCFTLATGTATTNNPCDGDLYFLTGQNVDLGAGASGTPYCLPANGVPASAASLADIPTDSSMCNWMGYVEGGNGLAGTGFIVRDTAALHHYRMHVTSNTLPTLVFEYDQID